MSEVVGMRMIRSIAMLLIRFVMFMKVDEEMMCINEETDTSCGCYMKNAISSMITIVLLSIVCYMIIVVPVGLMLSK